MSEPGIFFLEGKLGQYNPAAKLLAALLIALGLLVSDDITSASVALAVECIALGVFAIPYKAVFKKTYPLFLAAISVAIANIVASKASSLVIAGISLRLVAIAMPGILLFSSTDPVDLADSLVQQFRISPRYAYAALASFRLLPLLSEEFSLIIRARRSRGIDYGRGPIAKLVLFVTSVFALFVSAIRKANRLAMTMDARGFNLKVSRTSAREQKVQKHDAVLILSALAMVLIANMAGMLVGTWHVVLLSV
ncbi:MAG: energy-coupling factor transporter transmembrane protein EcfT [Firmicutes bacterium]|jgi:energy-coupling factor transport system permease protein|nr:energy-coupling factor transporter transmembrane protein EcfT [Bacillota bacterium]